MPLRILSIPVQPSTGRIQAIKNSAGFSIKKLSFTLQKAAMSDTEGRTSHIAKRRKVTHDELARNDSGAANGEMVSLVSLSRPVTPPFACRTPQVETKQRRTSTHVPSKDGYTIIPSPIQLTHIQGLSDNSGNNIDTIKLRDILGDPMIKECWQFNFCFDIDFIMDQFDPDVKSIVQVKVVHGSWKKESPNRIRIEVGIRSIA